MFRVKRETPVASPNKIELTLDKGEPLRVSFVGDSMDYGLFATEQRLGFHQLVVAEWRNNGPVADNDANTIGGTAGDALTTPDFPRDQQLYVVVLGTNDATRVDYRLFRTQYNELLDRIHSASPDAALVVHRGVETEGDRRHFRYDHQGSLRSTGRRVPEYQ